MGSTTPPRTSPTTTRSVTGKIAWADLKEFPDYYTRLKRMEDEAEARPRGRMSAP